MIAFSSASLIALSIGCLILNFYAFRSDAAAAGHGKKKVLQMIAIWAVVFAGLALVIGYFQ